MICFPIKAFQYFHVVFFVGCNVAKPTWSCSVFQKPELMIYMVYYRTIWADLNGVNSAYTLNNVCVSSHCDLLGDHCHQVVLDQLASTWIWTHVIFLLHCSQMLNFIDFSSQWFDCCGCLVYILWCHPSHFPCSISLSPLSAFCLSHL